MISSIALFAALLAPQTASPSDLGTAFGELKGHNVLQLTLSGTEMVSGNPHSIYAEGKWYQENHSDGTKTLQLSVAVAKDGAWRGVWVADGTTLWYYDPVRNEYATRAYGTDSASNPTAYPEQLLGSLVNWSRLEGRFMARLFSDLQLSTTSSALHHWLPGSELGAFTDTVYLRLGNPVERQYLFNLDHISRALSSMQYYERRDFSSTDIHEVNWTMTFTRLSSLPSSWSFSYQPPTGAVAIAHPRD